MAREKFSLEHSWDGVPNFCLIKQHNIISWDSWPVPLLRGLKAKDTFLFYSSQSRSRIATRVKVIRVTIYLLCIREAAHGTLRPALHGHRVPLRSLGPIWLPWVPMSLLRSWRRSLLLRVWVSPAIWLRSHLAHLIHWTGWLQNKEHFINLKLWWPLANMNIKLQCMGLLKSVCHIGNQLLWKSNGTDPVILKWVI